MRGGRSLPPQAGGGRGQGRNRPVREWSLTLDLVGCLRSPTSRQVTRLPGSMIVSIERSSSGIMRRRSPALRQLVAHPCAAHEVDLASTWDDLHQALRRLDRYVEAIEAKQKPIAAGYRSEPDPRRVSRTGRTSSPRRRAVHGLCATGIATTSGCATPLLSPMQSPVTMPPLSDWAREGIDTALRLGDPDQVIDQLLEIVQVARSAQGVQPRLEAPLPTRRRSGGPSIPPGDMQRQNRHDPSLTPSSQGDMLVVVDSLHRPEDRNHHFNAGARRSKSSAEFRQLVHD